MLAMLTMESLPYSYSFVSIIGQILDSKRASLGTPRSVQTVFLQ